jgi:hypothetical protein
MTLETMTMMNGAVIFNGISDEELIIILEGKKDHIGSLGFNPQEMQPIPVPPPPIPGRRGLSL